MFGDSELVRTPSPVSPLAAAASSNATPIAAAVNGIRTLRPSPDGQIIAVGDRRGSLQYVLVSRGATSLAVYDDDRPLTFAAHAYHIVAAFST